MIDFLSGWEYGYLVAAIIIALVLIRLVKVLVVQDFYRSWVHLIKPALVVILIVSIYFGYSRTRRVWDNLIYIQQFESEVGDPLLARPSDWEEAGVPKNAIDSVRRKIDLMFAEQRKAWPVSLIQNHKNMTVPIAVGGVTSDSLMLTVKHVTEWNHERDTLIDTTYYEIELAALEVIDSLYSEIGKLNRNVILLDSVYSMKIEKWLVTDSLRVQFIKENEEVMATPESPIN